tara:strand:- start:3102 stop:5327 length:2226 start_codon:yes stop_codon:yes gene_type:complete
MSIQKYLVEIIGKDKTGKAFKQVQNNTDKAKESVINLKNAIIALGTGAAIRSIINTTAKFQDLRTALTSVTGSAEGGAEAFAFISKFATQTQFGVDELTETFIKLKAAGIDPTQKLLTTFTDTAAVTTDQLGSLQAITDLFARSISGGLGLEDLNRLADRGVPVFRILEEQLGLTRLEVSKFGQTTEGAAKVRDALVRGLNQSFGGATAERVKNLSTQMSNLGIAFTNAQDVLGQGFSVELGNALDGITNFTVENEELIRSIGEGLGAALGATTKGFKNLFDNAELLRNIFTALIAIKLATVLSTITVSTKTLTTAFAILNSTMAKNPFLIIGGVAVTAIALFGKKLQDLTNTTDLARQIQEKYTDELEATTKATQDAKEATREFNESTIKSLNLSTEIVDKNREINILREANLEIEQKINRLTKGKANLSGQALQDLKDEIKTNELLIEILEEDIDLLIEKSRAVQDDTNSTIKNTKAIKDNIHAQRDLGKEILDARKAFEDKGMATIREFDPGRAEIEAEANKQATLLKLRNDGFISEEKFRNLSEISQSESNQRLFELFKQGKLDELDFARMSEQTKRSILISSGRDVLSQLAQTNKKAFQIHKAFAIGEAIISTHQGVSKGLAKGFPLGYIEAAITLAKGLATVSAIRAQSFQGRALGGNVSQGKPYMVGEQGAELFVPSETGTIVANKDLGRSTNVNITIMANDTEGFDDLLLKRRSTIVNVINDALNTQGKEALV